MSELLLVLGCVALGAIVGVVAMSLAVMSKDVGSRHAEASPPLGESTSSYRS